MNDRPRLPRRRFDSSSLIPTEDGTELPIEPLPLEGEVGDPLPSVNTGPIVVVPIGQIEERILKGVVSAVTTAFDRLVRVAKALPVPKYAYNPSREQYHSAAILKRVEGLCGEDWGAAIGVCDVDLFVPEVPFVFSEADRSTRSAVISMSRLRAEIGSPESRHDALVKRLASEVIHQMGLVRGLAHCPNNRCVMFLSATVQDTDKKGLQFCANCRKRLASDS